MTNENPQVVDKRRFTTLAIEEPVLCLRCGHERRFSDNEGGTCEKIADEEGHFCGCGCEFPPEPHFATFSPSSQPSTSPGMDFPTAMKQVIKGQRVTRLEWENPDIWLMMFYWGQINPKVQAGKYLSIHHADGAVSPLYIGDGDLLADDWIVVV